MRSEPLTEAWNQKNGRISLNTANLTLIRPKMLENGRISGRKVTGMSLQDNKMAVLRQFGQEPEPISLPDLLAKLGEGFKERSVKLNEEGNGL